MALALLVGLVGCSDGDGDGGDDAADATTTTATSTTTTSTTTTGGGAGSPALELRPVLAAVAGPYDASAASPCGPAPDAGATVLLPALSGPGAEPEYCSAMGPVGFDGTGLESVEAGPGGATGDAWVVTVQVAPAERDLANTLFNACFRADPTCPTQQLAIVLDDVVISAPTVQGEDLADDEFVISSGTGSGGYTEDQARELVARIQGR